MAPAALVPAIQLQYTQADPKNDPQLVTQTVLSGKGLMPPLRNELSDQEIAAVVSYIRSTWSNNSPPVTVDMVLNRNQ